MRNQLFHGLLSTENRVPSRSDRKWLIHRRHRSVRKR
ncbi:MAG: hypothetical protein IPO08_24045 [Xanthomonadales bacterium]|nr:hypothetical protein [Xanthomonadales bacterium]